MQDGRYDTTFLNSRREAIVVAGFYLCVLVYTLAYCYFFGYGRAPGEIVTYVGIPDWVLWGVMAPWMVSGAFTFWFCFFFIKDDPLEPPNAASETHPAGMGEAECSGKINE